MASWRRAAKWIPFSFPLFAGIVGLLYFPQAEGHIQSALTISRAEYRSFLLENWKKQALARVRATMPALSEEQEAESYEVREVLKAKVSENGWSPRQLAELSSYIVLRSQEYGVSPFFTLSLIEVESEFQNRAVSAAGALGWMQLMPATAEKLAGNNWEGAESLADPRVNIDLGLRYVKELRARFDSQKNVLIAYNIGPAALERKLKNGERLPTGYYRRVMHVMKGYHRGAAPPATTQWL